MLEMTLYIKVTLPPIDNNLPFEVNNFAFNDLKTGFQKAELLWFSPTEKPKVC